jgi:acetyl-CoA synthetase (ADP-forming)
MLTHEDTIAILKRYKIPYAKEFVGSQGPALRSGIGYPCVLKAVSADIVHKTDAGAIMTGIENASELKSAMEGIKKRVKSKYPNAKIRFMVQRQEHGHEIIMGMKRDAQFGPVILFGLGGVFVELFKDVSMRIAPLGAKDIKDMITGIRAYRILAGYRGEKGVDIKAISDMLKKLSQLSMKEARISEIDFNPVIASENRAVVVDARMIENE